MKGLLRNAVSFFEKQKAKPSTENEMGSSGGEI